jgi:hypothetical protein
MRVEADGDVVVKAAETEGERRRLAREALTLREVAHPGIVHLREVDGGEPPERILLNRVNGTPLSECDAQPSHVVVSWGAAVATILADLHERGYAHGAVQADHILLDRRARPVLCGLGSAVRLGDPATAGAAAGDVADLARLVGQRLGPEDRRLQKALAGWETAGRRRRRDARALAAFLVRRAPREPVGPFEPWGEPEVDRPPETRAEVGVARRRVSRAAPVLALAAGLIGVLAGWSLRGQPAAHRQGGVSVPAFLVASPPGEDPVLVVGRWGCGTARPAVLDLVSGAIWAYPSWPRAGARTSGTFLTEVPGATGLAAAGNGQGCDRLIALRGSSGAVVPVELAGSRG